MKNFPGTLIILELYVLGCMSVGCMSKTLATHNGADEALALIEACPSWLRGPGGQFPDPGPIMSCLRQLDGFQTPVLRAAIQQYQRAHARVGNNRAAATIFLLNRYLFNVPEWAPLTNGLGFGGWVGVPRRPREINLMYPLYAGPAGEISLGPGQVGLNGSYAAIEEFDYLEQTYGRRQSYAPKQMH